MSGGKVLDKVVEEYNMHFNWAHMHLYFGAVHYCMCKQPLFSLTLKAEIWLEDDQHTDSGLPEAQNQRGRELGGVCF